MPNGLLELMISCDWCTRILDFVRNIVLERLGLLGVGVRSLKKTSRSQRPSQPEKQHGQIMDEAIHCFSKLQDEARIPRYYQEFNLLDRIRSLQCFQTILSDTSEDEVHYFLRKDPQILLGVRLAYLVRRRSRASPLAN